MGGSKVSRRASEFVGVALFAAALIWIIALASYEPSDPAWFFSTGAHAAPANFAGRVGAFFAELSFQLFGYASYLGPAALVIIGWNSFWCRSLDAAGTKVIGAGMLFACLSAFLGLVLGTLDASGKPFRAGGYAGEFLAHEMSEYLNKTGSVIVVLTLMVLATIMSTQFSFGRFFAAATEGAHGGATRGLDAFHAWREERRREKQRREVIAKHTRKGAPAPEIKTPGVQSAVSVADTPAAKAKSALSRVFSRSKDADTPAAAAAPAAAAPAVAAAGPRSFAPPKPPKVVRRRCRCPIPSRCPRRRPNAARGSTPCRRCRCSTQSRPSARSTSAN